MRAELSVKVKGKAQVIALLFRFNAKPDCDGGFSLVKVNADLCHCAGV
jgi:hypothetical protein